jgi:hypothetical protein
MTPKDKMAAMMAAPDQGEFLQSEKDLRPHFETERRGMFWPIARNGYNNALSLAMPEALGGHGAKVMHDIVQGKPLTQDEVSHGAQGAANFMFTSGLAGNIGKRPQAGVMSSSGAQPPKVPDLPMDQASRMQRAKDMGFDVETPLYHGTAAKNIESFDVGKAGSVQYSDWGPGVYFTPSKWMADEYRVDAVKKIDPAYNAAYEKWENLSKNTPVKNGAPQYSAEANAALAEFQRIGRETRSGGQVIEAFTNLKKPYNLPYQSMPDPTLAKYAAERGHDGIRVLNGDGSLNEMVVFNPHNIRSVNAAFDPVMRDSANLLAANPATGAAIPLAGNAFDEQRPSIDEILRRYDGAY